MTEPMNMRRLCKVCGAWKLSRRCLRCEDRSNRETNEGIYLLNLAKYRAEIASRPFRPAIEDGALRGRPGTLRGQPGARHRRGGVPYDPNALVDDYGRAQQE